MPQHDVLQGEVVVLSRSAVIGSPLYGMFILELTQVYVSETTITGSGSLGMHNVGSAWTRQNNTIRENGAFGDNNADFSGSFPAQ